MCSRLEKKSLEGFTRNEVKVRVLPRSPNRPSSYPNGLEIEEIKSLKYQSVWEEPKRRGACVPVSVWNPFRSHCEGCPKAT